MPTTAALKRRFTLAIVLTWLVPAVLVHLFIALAELPPALNGVKNLGFASYLYTAVALVVVVILCRAQLGRAMRALAEDTGAAGDLPAPDFAPLRHLVWLTLGLIGVYLVAGMFLALAEADMLRRPAPGELVLAAGVLGLMFLVMATPLYVYCHGLFGVAFGPLLGSRKVLPLSLRMLVVGLGIAVVGASFTLVYEFAIAGAYKPELLMVWASQLSYALLVSIMAYRSQNQSLAPLGRLLDLDRSGSTDEVEAVKARSLDEIGVITNRMRDLLKARRAYEGELKDSEARTRMFAEAASDYLYEIDEDLNFSFVSDRFEELTGIPPGLVVGQSALNVGETYVSDAQRAHVEDLRAHRPYRNYRFSVQRRDGRTLHLQISALPIFDEHGRFKGYRGAGTDVTDFIETQQRLVEKEAQLAQAQKMEALGQLTGGVAHDFNNFLTTIIGNLELLEARGAPDDDGRRYARAALQAAQSSATVVQRLLAFSRRQSLSPEPTDVAALLVGLCEILRPTLGAAIDLRLDGCDAPVVCLVDPGQLEQAVLNLALNARDAMPDGGTLTLTLDRPSAPAGMVRIVVADSGKGIPQAQVPYVFEPFFTTKEPGQGSGLGLSMVYGFVNQSGGQVSIGVAEAGGARVEILLPGTQQTAAAQRVPSTAPIGAAPVDSAPGPGARVLVVEDDPNLSQVVRHTLADLGYEVAAVADGAAAVAYLDDHCEIDLVLCDVVLPGPLSGLDVLRHVDASGHAAAMLLMSGYAQGEIEHRGQLPGSVRILQKPFRRSQLAERVAECLERDRTAAGRRMG
ncbi:MAG: ATP-binding protein [Pseudomonadales bacterium]